MVKMKFQHILFVIMTVSLFGCMPNDAMFRVTGIAPFNSKCELHLLAEGKDAARPVPISDFFDTTFFVSFHEQQYELQAICEGQVTYEKTVTFSGVPNYDTPYDIGKISP